MIDLIKGSLLPGTVPFLLLAVFVGAALQALGRRRRSPGLERIGRRGLLAVAAVYLLISLPITADLVATSLRPGDRFTPASTAATIDAVVILSAGVDVYRVGQDVTQLPSSATALRTLEGLRIWKALGQRPWIVVMGGTVARGEIRSHASTMRELLNGSVPADRILVEETSVNTRQHAVNIHPVLRAHGIERFVLVTSATHLRRSLGSFRHEGLNPIGAAAPLWPGEHGPRGWRRWWPSQEALGISRATVYELVGLVYYGSRGWLSAAPRAMP